MQRLHIYNEILFMAMSRPRATITIRTFCQAQAEPAAVGPQPFGLLLMPSMSGVYRIYTLMSVYAPFPGRRP